MKRLDRETMALAFRIERALKAGMGDETLVRRIPLWRERLKLRAEKKELRRADLLNRLEAAEAAERESFEKIAGKEVTK